MKTNILNILKLIRPDADFKKSSNFIKDDLLDSFDLMRLILKIEEIYNIEVSIDLIDEDNFKDISSIENTISLCGGHKCN